MGIVPRIAAAFVPIKLIVAEAYGILAYLAAGLDGGVDTATRIFWTVYEMADKMV